MTKPQSIDQKIANANMVLSQLRDWMEEMERQDLIDWADKLELEILRQISELEEIQND